MDLPSFIWLWKIAAWSMGLSLLAYFLLAVTGIWMFRTRASGNPSFAGAVAGGLWRTTHTPLCNGYHYGCFSDTATRYWYCRYFR